MTLDAWLEAAIADARRRGLPQVEPLLKSLAEATRALREASLAETSAPGPIAAPSVWPQAQASITGAGAPLSLPAAGTPPPPPVLDAFVSRTSSGLPARAAADTSLSIEEFGRRWRAHELSAEEVTTDCLRRIDAEDSRLNAFILVMREEAIRQARQADRDLARGTDRGPLHGVPISIKDIVDVRGTATTAASRVRAGHVATADAPVVTRLRRAGAVLIGKTNLHEFAFGTTNEDSAFGPCRNPYDLERSPGGSSGGSAVSVAAGMALASLGSDTGGSIRIPAAACGIVGLKPTINELSTEGVVPLSRTLDHLGPLTSTVADAWHMYHGLMHRKTRRPLSPAAIAGLRIGVLRSYFCDVLDEQVRGSFESVLDVLRAAGARADDRQIAHASLTAPTYQHISFGEASAYHAPTLASVPELYTPGVRTRLEMAGYVLSQDYVLAMAARDVLRREVDAALADHDCLVLPTLPIPAPRLGASTVDINSRPEPVRALMLRLTQLFDLTGHPAVSLPCASTTEGLPCGFQLVGRCGGTDALLCIALAVDRVLGRKRRL